MNALKEASLGVDVNSNVTYSNSNHYQELFDVAQLTDTDLILDTK